MEIACPLYFFPQSKEWGATTEMLAGFAAIFLIMLIIREYPIILLIIFGIPIALGILIWILSELLGVSSRSSGHASAPKSYSAYGNNAGYEDNESGKTILYDQYGTFVLGTAVGEKLFRGMHHPEVHDVSLVDGYYRDGRVYTGSRTTPIGIFRNGQIFMGSYERFGAGQDGSYRNGYVYKGVGFDERCVATYKGSDAAAAALAILFLFS